MSLLPIGSSSVGSPFNFNVSSLLSEARALVNAVRDFKDLRVPESFDGQRPRLPSWDPCRCYCPEPPPHCPPPSDLNVGPDGKIHTPGGYTIEACGNTKWTITGPDGKCTTVSGDPHVTESDGGKWDFKRNSSFVLADGTTINVKTTPAGNGMTVTSGLEVVNGDSRVEVTGVNTGHPNVGRPEHGGQQWNTAGWDKFVMGSQTDDWAFGGREIVGSEKGGDVLKVGDPLLPGHSPVPPRPGPVPIPAPTPVPGTVPTPPGGGLTDLIRQMIEAIQRMLQLISQLQPPPPRMVPFAA